MGMFFSICQGSCFGCFFFFQYDLEAFHFFFDDWGKDEHGNQVWNSHEGVSNIGKVPYQIQGLGSTYIDNQGKYDTIDHVVFMGSEKVFPCFFTVVFPTKDGGEGEENDTYSYNERTNFTNVGGEGSHGKFYPFERFAIGTNGAKNTRGSNGKTSDGAHNNGIPEGTGHIDVALTDWIVGGSSGCGDSSGAHTSFIGEAPTSDAETNGIHHRSGDATKDTATHCLWVKGHHENQIETVWNVFNIDDNAKQAGNDIEESHGWYNYRRYFGNGFDTANDDNQRQNGENDTAHFQWHTEGGFHSSGNRIGLGHVADTKGSDDSKECEQESHDTAQFLIFETVLHGKHRAAFHFAFCIDFTVLDSQHTFGKFGGQAEACGDPHPYQCARTAGKHSGSNADDVTSTNGGSQGGHECGKRRYVAGAALLGAGFFGKYTADCIGQVSPGSKFQ